MQVKQQQLVEAKNHDLQTQKTYLNVELAARDAQIEELKKANANIELLRLDFQRYGKRKGK
jgi:phage terminase Nu1 subunit (DNA packaging protein)